MGSERLPRYRTHMFAHRIVDMEPSTVVEVFPQGERRGSFVAEVLGRVESPKQLSNPMVKVRDLKRHTADGFELLGAGTSVRRKIPYILTRIVS